MTIRAAQVHDAGAIGMVHVRSWQETYRGHFPQVFLDGLDPRERGGRWERHLRSGPHPREEILVVESGGDVVGFANVGPCRDRGGDPADAGASGDAAEGEVRAIYLLPDRWGQGLGRRLMGAAVDHLAGAGFSEAVLWVLDDNHRARRFYELGGWRADGASKVDDSLGFAITELRYRRTLR